MHNFGAEPCRLDLPLDDLDDAVGADDLLDGSREHPLDEPVLHLTLDGYGYRWLRIRRARPAAVALTRRAGARRRRYQGGLMRHQPPGLGYVDVGLSDHGVSMSGVEPGQELTVSIRREARSAVIELAGELDLHESRRLSAAVAEILSERVELVELDATALTFIDSAGLRAILLARAGAAEQGVTFLISGVSPQIRRVMEIAGAEDLLPDD